MGVIGVTSDGQFPIMSSMEEIFKNSWGRDMQNYERIKGSNGSVGINTQGAMNATYGPYLQNLAYNKHNTFAVLGQAPYKTGWRAQYDLSLANTATTGIVRGGNAPMPTQGKYAHIEMPYKVSAKRQAMDIGFIEIGAKDIDDVAVWQDFINKEGATWLNSINNDILKPVDSARAVGLGSAIGGGVDATADNAGEYVGFESIDRIISSIGEGAFVDADASAVNNVPWAMATQLPSTDSPATMMKYRNPNATGAVTGGSNFDSYVDANYTAVGSATARQLDLSMIDNLFMQCMPYWEDNKTDGAALVTRYDTLQHIQTLLQPQQRFIGQVGAQFDVNGVTTVPGRNTGFMVSTYNGVPMIPDLMVQGGTPADHTTGVGDIFLLHKDIIHFGTLRAPTVEVSDNALITGRYSRVCDMNMLGETQVEGMFKGLGKIKHLK